MWLFGSLANTDASAAAPPFRRHHHTPKPTDIVYTQTCAMDTLTISLVYYALTATQSRAQRIVSPVNDTLFDTCNVWHFRLCSSHCSSWLLLLLLLRLTAQHAIFSPSHSRNINIGYASVWHRKLITRVLGERPKMSLFTLGTTMHNQPASQSEAQLRGWRRQQNIDMYDVKKKIERPEPGTRLRNKSKRRVVTSRRDNRTHLIRVMIDTTLE